MTFDEALSYVTDALQFGINPGLEKIEAICRALGDPQLSYPVIQVTGTNGKTSVTRMIARILDEQGLKTGRYTSPHLSSYTERIAVSGRDIAEVDFARAVEAVMPVADGVAAELGPLTEFEILTAAALWFFVDAKVDAAILEVGLGGRWDATSVTKPKVSVLTNVALDHKDRLGDTISRIAWDKAHIIKEDSITVTGTLHPEALAEVEKRASSVGSELLVLGRDFRLRRRPPGAAHAPGSFDVDGLYAFYGDLHLKVLGDFQMENAAVAVAAAEALQDGPLSEDDLAKALSEVLCPGRMEIISHEPVVLVDGAHNPAGMERLVASLNEVFAGRRPTVVLSVSADKDLAGVIRAIAPLAATLVLTRNKSDRSATAAELSESAGGSNHIVAADLPDAIERAVSVTPGDGIIVIAGSLYAVGEAREIWSARNRHRAKV